jgi:hypothetical protein
MSRPQHIRSETAPYPFGKAADWSQAFESRADARQIQPQELLVESRVQEKESGNTAPHRSAFPMCDYSLHLIASRPAKVADRLVSTDFVKSITRGFTEIGHPDVAVCLLPGTELAFDNEVQFDRAFSMFGKARVEHRVARFRQVNMDDPHVHHDALEFPGGQIVMVTRLVPGQTAMVLQLPAAPHDHGAGKQEQIAQARDPVLTT